MASRKRAPDRGNLEALRCANKGVNVWRPPVKEAAIENRFAVELKRWHRYFVTRKLNGMGHAHWPDRMVLGPGGFVMFIEFKKPGQVPTPAQAENHKMLRDLGHVVYTCTSWESALGAVQREYTKYHNV